MGSGDYAELQDGNQPSQGIKPPEDGLINVKVVRKRYRMMAELFLHECSHWGEEDGYHGSYCHVQDSILLEPWWTVDCRQELWFLESFKQVLVSKHQKFSGVRVLDFAQFEPKYFSDIFGQGAQYGGIKVTSTSREQSTKLPAQYANLRLVYTYAGDGNSYVGNEYWQGAQNEEYLSASSDPAAASSTLLPWLENPDVN